MLFKVDENLSVKVAELLRQAGHDVMTVAEQRMAGSPDPSLAAICQKEGRALVTLDLDFADIRTYPPANYPGLIVLRLGSQSMSRISRAVSRVITLLQSQPLAGKLWIVDESAARIR
jgi:predicted nuclease of predicted toxin-antitoxin system